MMMKVYWKTCHGTEWNNTLFTIKKIEKKFYKLNVVSFLFGLSASILGETLDLDRVSYWASLS